MKASGAADPAGGGAASIETRRGAVGRSVVGAVGAGSIQRFLATLKSDRPRGK